MSCEGYEACLEIDLLVFSSVPGWQVCLRPCCSCASLSAMQSHVATKFQILEAQGASLVTGCRKSRLVRRLHQECHFLLSDSKINLMPIATADLVFAASDTVKTLRGKQVLHGKLPHSNKQAFGKTVPGQ